ncbi:MAG: pyridoxine 5'-phosphate synthase [Acidobacteriota bacterium]|nr:pyridoxine 5'-phosphate synthase [Acidobacteriota bacterium]
MAARLSVNVNKIATIRNARGGRVPGVVDAVRACLDAGAPGITVHPRADERHITRQDVRDIAAFLAPHRGRVEFNIEGDPRAELMELVLEVQPDQCTLVPVVPGEITSQAGWPASTSPERLTAIIKRLQMDRIRVSMFVDPDESAIRWARRLGADRIELYTEPYARDFAAGPAQRSAAFSAYAASAELAHGLGMGINAGHDLDLENLPLFRTLPHLDEVSIGHALVSRAIFVGLDRAVRDYLAVLV